MIVKKLVEKKFLKSYQVEVEKFKKLSIKLQYLEGKPAIDNIKINSKPGQRRYVSYKDLKPVLSGYGYTILSTPLGILTNKEARLKKVGGEMLFSIW